jgi:hypothetical protein
MSKNLYHISLKSHGISKLFYPRVPDNRFHGEDVYHPYLDCDLPENDSIPRICVSSTINGAIRALPLIGNSKIWVYVADNPVAVSRDMPLYMVPDAKQTKEHWILEPTIMLQLGSMKIEIDGDFRIIKKEWLKKTVYYEKYCGRKK